MGLRESARKFGVPKSTLRNKVYGRFPGSVGRPTVFSLKQEEDLVQRILERTDNGGSITKNEILDGVQTVCESMNIKNHFKNGRPGRSWYDGFMQRHPGLKKRVFSQEYKSTNMSGDNGLNIKKCTIKLN